ncbi:MAG: PIG-L family deacetylase, partial [Planctomycetes bacterium]|nr:PIG-L family deacetylase [Planctomycetota bacterium]
MKSSQYRRRLWAESIRWLTVVLAGACLVPHASLAQHEPGYVDTGTVGLGLALRRLETSASLLYITAHPDDEDNGLLARLSRGEGKRVATLTLTRGEGGQNEIGSELFDELGVLRSEELLAVHRLDGVQQFFGRVVDFGYSFSVEETLDEWGREETVGDIVRVIRSFRPDVIVTLVPDGEGGGQHHQATARLATEAFAMAADRDRFPEHLEEGLRTWRAKKLYRALWNPSDEERNQAVGVELGGFDHLLGMSYGEFGALARNLHRCQGMNASPVPGFQERWYRLAQPRSQSSPNEPMFTGVEETLGGALRAALAGVAEEDGSQLVALADQCRQAFTASRFADVERIVLNGLAEVRRLRSAVARSKLPSNRKFEARFLLGAEQRDWREAATKALQLHYDAEVVAGDGLFVPGEVFEVKTTLVHRGSKTIRIGRVALGAPTGWQVRSLDRNADVLEHNDKSVARFQVTVSPAAEATQPYFSRDNLRQSRYTNPVGPSKSFVPFARPPLHATWMIAVHGETFSIRKPVVYRWYDSAVGRRRSYAVKVVPAISLTVAPEQNVVPLGSSDRARVVTVHVHANQAPAKVTVGLELPTGWASTPPNSVVDFARENESASVAFVVTPPSEVVAGAFVAAANAEFDGTTYRSGYRTIAYHHVETRHLYRQARSTFRVVDVRLPENLEVGYVMGVGDGVAAAIEQLGARVTLLGGVDLATGDLSRFDAIVTGVRAYKDRDDLIGNNQRLLDYMSRGGVMIVQYNKYEFNEAQYGPFPTKIARPHDRVTDEAAAVSV